MKRLCPSLIFEACDSTCGILSCTSEISSETAVDFGGYPVSIYSMLAASGLCRWYMHWSGRTLFASIWAGQRCTFDTVG